MNELRELLEQVNTNRQLGSIECVPEHLVRDVERHLHNLGLQTLVIRTPDNDYTIAYHRNCPKDILQLYVKYERMGGDAEALTPEEHRVLGRAFGYSEDEIEWFIQEVFGE